MVASTALVATNMEGSNMLILDILGLALWVTALVLFVLARKERNR